MYGDQDLLLYTHLLCFKASVIVFIFVNKRPLTTLYFNMLAVSFHLCDLCRKVSHTVAHSQAFNGTVVEGLFKLMFP